MPKRRRRRPHPAAPPWPVGSQKFNSEITRILHQNNCLRTRSETMGALTPQKGGLGSPATLRGVLAEKIRLIRFHLQLNFGVLTSFNPYGT